MSNAPSNPKYEQTRRQIEELEALLRKLLGPRGEAKTDATPVRTAKSPSVEFVRADAAQTALPPPKMTMSPSVRSEAAMLAKSAATLQALAPEPEPIQKAFEPPPAPELPEAAKVDVQSQRTPAQPCEPEPIEPEPAAGPVQAANEAEVPSIPDRPLAPREMDVTRFDLSEATNLQLVRDDFIGGIGGDVSASIEDHRKLIVSRIEWAKHLWKTIKGSLGLIGIGLLGLAVMLWTSQWFGWTWWGLPSMILGRFGLGSQ